MPRPPKICTAMGACMHVRTLNNAILTWTGCGRVDTVVGFIIGSDQMLCETNETVVNVIREMGESPTSELEEELREADV